MRGGFDLQLCGEGKRSPGRLGNPPFPLLIIMGILFMKRQNSLFNSESRKDGIV